MASTNKTTNYDLSQYVGTDKPTYLGDYNSDMLKIDTQMKTNADNVATAINSASTATETANTANTTAGQANTKAGQALTTAQNATTTAGNAQTTANSALATATTAQTSANTANDKVDKFNLSVFETIPNTAMSKTGNAGAIDGTLYVAKNTEGSIAKIYGMVQIIANNATGTLIIPTSLRPSEDLSINGVVIRSIYAGTTVKNVGMVTMTIRTNGNIEVPYTIVTGNTNDGDRFMFTACMLFIEPFEDEPIPEGQ